MLFPLALAFSKDAPNKATSVLIIGESENTVSTHSRFISFLASTRRKATFKSATTQHIPIITNGEYLYNAIILLCPSANLDKQIPLAHLLRFIEDGHDLFLAVGQPYSRYMGKVAQAIGVDLDSSSHVLTDHQQVFTELDLGDHSFIKAGGKTASQYLFGDAASNDASSIVFRGPGASLFKDNELVDCVIWGSGSSYSQKGALTKVPRASGTSSVMAAALSTRTGGRATYWGSAEALTDSVFKTAGKDHEAAMSGLLSWTLGERGVVRAGALRHRRIEDGDDRTEYRVKDEIEVEIELGVWDGASEEWKAFVADDIQIEFVMMDPWMRTRLMYKGGANGTYGATVAVPDQIGVYKLNVQYFRPGVSPLSIVEVVPVRPFLHNEYERFIQMATPYYVASFSMLVGVFLMGCVLLFSRDEEEEKKNK